MHGIISGDTHRHAYPIVASCCMTNHPIPGQSCTLSLQQICSDMYGLLELPDPQAYAAMRMDAAGRLREEGPHARQRPLLSAELHLLDVFAALYLCSPADALAAWRQLEALADRALPGTVPQASMDRARYIAAVLMLTAGLLEDESVDRAVLREGLLAGSEIDPQLVLALLQDALVSGDSSLAMRAICKERAADQEPSDEFGKQFRRLALALLEGRATDRQLADLLQASRNYRHWQVLDGPLWQACLEAEIIPLENWKLHLEAHERCHEGVYRVISSLEAS